MDIKTQKALSLTEILVTTLVSSLVIGTIYSVFVVGNDSWGTYENNVFASKGVRNSMFRLPKELRQATIVTAPTDTAGVKSLQFSFPAPGGGGTENVTYSFSPQGNDANRIMRDGVIVASNISDVSFTADFESVNATLLTINDPFLNLYLGDDEQDEATLSVDNVAKPADATGALLTLTIYDPDNFDEGELRINGNGPLGLFGAQSGAEAGGPLNPAFDRVNATFTYPTDAAWWVEGTNELQFLRLRTDGYRIEAASVEFITSGIESLAINITAEETSKTGQLSSFTLNGRVNIPAQD